MSDANDNNLTSAQVSQDSDTTRTVDTFNGGTSPKGTLSAGLSSNSLAATPVADNKKENKQKNGFCQYSTIVIICALLFIIAQVIQIRGFRNTQQRLLDSYTVLENNNLHFYDPNDDSIALYAESLGLSESQKNSLVFLINEIVYDTFSRSKEKESNSVDVQELLEETKGIVDMQLARIKQEYEAMQIWYGILTVVFLLFSFFSLYKTDEMLSRTEQAQLRIQTTNDDVQEKALSMKATIDDTIKKAEVDMRNYQRSLRVSMVKANQELMKDIQADTERLLSDIKKKQNDYTQTYDELKRKVDALSAAVDNYKSIVDRIIKTSF